MHAIARVQNTNDKSNREPIKSVTDKGPHLLLLQPHALRVAIENYEKKDKKRNSQQNGNEREKASEKNVSTFSIVLNPNVLHGSIAAADIEWSTADFTNENIHHLTIS